MLTLFNGRRYGLLFYVLGVLLYGIFGMADCAAQTHRPWVLVVVKPDTAVLAPAIQYLADSVEDDIKQRNAETIQAMEAFLSAGYTVGDREQYLNTRDAYREALPQLKAHAQALADFRYYEFISWGAAQLFEFYFNDHPASVRVQEAEACIDCAPAAMASAQQADYLVCFKDIHTVDTQGEVTLDLTVMLYNAGSQKTFTYGLRSISATPQGGVTAWWPYTDTLTNLFINAVNRAVPSVIAADGVLRTCTYKIDYQEK